MEPKELKETKYYELEALQFARDQINTENKTGVVKYLESQASIEKEVRDTVYSKIQKSVEKIDLK